jgi:proline iminopeptidase
MTPDLCQEDLIVESGYVQIPSRKNVQVKYWRYGNVTTAPPLIVANGGPGYPHNYTLPLKQIACRHRQVIFYDQAGCGESLVGDGRGDNNFTQKYSFLLNVSYYATEELPAVLNALDVDSFHLLGHSWGTMLALEYAINSTDALRNNMLSLTLSSPVPSFQEYARLQWDRQNGLMYQMLPPYLLERLRALIDVGDFNDPEYQLISDLCSDRFLLRTAVSMDCLEATMAGANMDIYVGMQGVGEFSEATGTLKSFDGFTNLPEIDIPVLLMAGEFDVVRPYTLEKMQHMLRVPLEIAYIETAGHFVMLDNAGAVNNLISNFLARIESGEKIGSTQQTHEDEDTTIDPGHTRGHFQYLKFFASLILGIVIGFFAASKRNSDGYEAL